MSYVQAGSAQEIDPTILLPLTRLMGLNIPPEELMSLATTLADQLASVSALDELDLTDINPIISMDARWYE
jgi:Asp-tRNA(Asn)/Glu-tRNA(Gln) amidotransferase C subunit